MACDATAGRLEPCKDQVGGLKNLYIINYTSGLESTATFDSDEEITAFATALTLYKYELRGGQSMEDSIETSADTGTTFTTQSGTFVLKKQDKATRKQLKLVSRGRPHVVTEDYNGNFKIHGLENGCDVNYSATTGSAMGDLSGYNLTVTATEKEEAHFILPSIIGDTTNTVVVVGT